MWLNRLLLTGLLAATAAPLHGSLTDQRVARAVAGANKLADPYVCIGRSVAGEFTVCLQGPEQRVGLAQTWTLIVRLNQPALVDSRPVSTPLAEDLKLRLRGHSEWSTAGVRDPQTKSPTTTD